MRIVACLQRSVLVITLLAINDGCSPAARNNMGAGANTAASGSGITRQAKLMLFGGEGHRTYLGCLRRSEYVVDSVSNEYSDHGSRYSNTSVWNHNSEFGFQYSNYGACNPYANDPRVIVDSEGKFYGRLTLNAYHPQIGAGTRYNEWLVNKVCER
jgi:hypothetical protein